MSKQTAVELLFLEFKALSKVSRNAGDEESANLIDFLCEREQQAKEMEKQQIIDAFNNGEFFPSDYYHPNNPSVDGSETYYNETYGGDK